MIGVFDSGLGGLTVLRALRQRFPTLDFRYLADHAHVPYGNRPADEVIDLTRIAVERLFQSGSRLVLLGCNTATAVAARTLQQDWLSASGWRAKGHNILGIVAPTVEAATQTPYAVTTPQYPQKNNTDLIAVFATTRTVTSGVFPEEIRKRCPKVEVVQQACPGLAGAIEDAASMTELERLVAAAVDGMMAQTGGRPPHRAILGCTHYPIVEHVFRRHLAPFTRLLSQPEAVADSLEDYLGRHTHYAEGCYGSRMALWTTGDAVATTRLAQVFWPGVPAFVTAPV
jgi:glutamate racemase